MSYVIDSRIADTIYDCDFRFDIELSQDEEDGDITIYLDNFKQDTSLSTHFKCSDLDLIVALLCAIDEYNTDYAVYNILMNDSLPNYLRGDNFSISKMLELRDSIQMRFNRLSDELDKLRPIIAKTGYKREIVYYANCIIRINDSNCRISDLTDVERKIVEEDIQRILNGETMYVDGKFTTIGDKKVV